MKQKRWGSRFPGNRFAAEWHGEIQINTAGVYTFNTLSDDGSNLYIEDALVVNNWGLHAPRRREGTKNLLQGWHHVVIEFYENYGGAKCVVKYAGPDTNGSETLLAAYH